MESQCGIWTPHIFVVQRILLAGSRKENIMQKIVSPSIAESVVSRAIREGKIHVERIGKIIDKYNPENTIAEKMIVFWGDFVITVFRTKLEWIGDFPIKNFIMEKYPCEYACNIIAEIEQLRKEWTSGII